MLIAGTESVQTIAGRFGCTVRVLQKRQVVLEKSGLISRRILTRAARKMKHETVLPKTLVESARQGAIDIMVATAVHVLGRHQEHIHTGREIVRRLFAELEGLIRDRDEIEDEIEEATQTEGANGSIRVQHKLRARYLRAVALPENASTVNQLANALERLIRLERQVWGIPDVPPEAPPKEGEEDTPEALMTIRALTEALRKANGAPDTITIDLPDAA